jgi:cobalt-precorrin-5B (C1)-methyltransferase
MRLWGGAFPKSVQITLPRGEMPEFALAHHEAGEGWAAVGITKDAGDDPDVTHGALIVARVSASDGGVVFRAGEGVGTVTKAGLPVPVGEPAVNPVPREMMQTIVQEMAAYYSQSPDIEITLSIPGGREIAQKTWNPRLGIQGGLSILGTTGIVRPFSCAAWVASIHRGVDVARADGLTHVAGTTGATSEQTIQSLYQLPDHAMLDMGDFAGGMLKYLSKHPIAHVTIGGGIGKMLKLAQGALDLHSSRSQVDFDALADTLHDPRLKNAHTALEAYEISGHIMAENIATQALSKVTAQFGEHMTFDIVVIDRKGSIIARADGRGL